MTLSEQSNPTRTARALVPAAQLHTAGTSRGLGRGGLAGRRTVNPVTWSPGARLRGWLLKACAGRARSRPARILAQRPQRSSGLAVRVRPGVGSALEPGGGPRVRLHPLSDSGSAPSRPWPQPSSATDPRPSPRAIDRRKFPWGRGYGSRPSARGLRGRPHPRGQPPQGRRPRQRRPLRQGRQQHRVAGAAGGGRSCGEWAVGPWGAHGPVAPVAELPLAGNYALTAPSAR